MPESYPFPMYSGLLEPKHYKQIGTALWFFLWCVSSTTKEEERDGETWGMVLGKKPLKLPELAKIFEVTEKTISRWIEALEKYKYIHVTRAPYGLIIEVRKSKKFMDKNVRSHDERTDKNVHSDENRSDKNVHSDENRSDKNVHSDENRSDKNVLSDEERSDIFVRSDSERVDKNVLSESREQTNMSDLSGREQTKMSDLPDKNVRSNKDITKDINIITPIIPIVGTNEKSFEELIEEPSREETPFIKVLDAFCHLHQKMDYAVREEDRALMKQLVARIPPQFIITTMQKVLKDKRQREGNQFDLPSTFSYYQKPILKAWRAEQGSQTDAQVPALPSVAPGYSSQKPQRGGTRNAIFGQHHAGASGTDQTYPFSGQTGRLNRKSRVQVPEV